MAKRSSLFAVKPEPAAAPEPEPVASKPGRRYPVAASRQGQRVATVYLPPEALRQLKRIAADEDATIQKLLIEGVNAVFEKRGKTRMA